MILGLKLGRRLIAACGLSDEEFQFRDSRYIGSRNQLLSTVPAYFQRLIDQSRPTTIYVYAPSVAESSTEEIVGLLEVEAAKAGIAVKRLTKTDVLGSFGLVPLQTRSDLRTTLIHLWPQLLENAEVRQVPLAEAAAAALIGDLREAWPPV
jgi:hypothetical protein